ncbi:cation:proton antiporter [Plebeiibacterium sediminum]|uniref:Cation:proton antiporter n=1 Tax=Plebeiibacterium sediminum TaxID=2992112 RepID=A0AAE3SHA8_9BACT|nr:cation:proton antiporter [Plebeiobacterium sediminum]MCW3789017.1 cation:proton antiporter [Plebeiobacterium sediminum]
MNVILSIGVLVFTAFVLGELAEKIKLPKISGYILAGILLNPDVTGIMNNEFVVHTDPLLTIALSFITFSIGGSLSASNLKATGKTVLWLTLSESIFAFLSVFVFMALWLYFFSNVYSSIYIIIAISLLLASLAAPTDPSATLAVIHEYKAKGPVSSAMLQIAAFDDIVGIIIYTLVAAFAPFFLGNHDIQLGTKLADMGMDILFALLIGAAIGLLFYFIVKMVKKETEGSLIVLTFGLILFAYGISDYFGFESLLASMALGAVVTNFNPMADKIFKLIERYTDELIFVIFFSLSGLHLQLSSVAGSVLLIAIYIVARAIGKYGGIFVSSSILNTDPKIKKFAAGGLIPQGGIVIGLSILLTKDPEYVSIGSLIIGVVIGAALIHEISGPLISRLTLKKAEEI